MDSLPNPHDQAENLSDAAVAGDKAPYVLGIDPHVSHVGLGTSYGIAADFPVSALPQSSIGERLACLRAALLRVLGNGFKTPAAVVVERPVGKYANPHLVMATGVIVEASSFAFPGVPTWQVATKEWKKLTVGKGTASKDLVRDWAIEHVGIRPSQDCYDAYAIAVAGARMLGL